MRYELVAPSQLTVQARSRIHDTTARWREVTGHLHVVPSDPTACDLLVSVNMDAVDAGDWLRTKKLRSDYDLARFRSATFTLRRLADAEADGAALRGIAHGTLRWRDRDVELAVQGSLRVTDKTVVAEATFELDVRKFGITAPRLLMLKVDDIVRVDVALHGRAIGA